MIDEKNIQKLLAGRALIDGIQKRNYEQINSLTSVKTDARIISRTEKQMLEIETATIIKANDGLSALGFNLMDEFFKFNNEACRDEYFECLEITRGELCGKCPTRACEAFFTKYPCSQKPLAPYSDKLTAEEYLGKAKEMIYTFWQKQIPAICPVGFGWIYGKKRDARFDLRWRPFLPQEKHFASYETEIKEEGDILNEQWRKITDS